MLNINMDYLEVVDRLKRVDEDLSLMYDNIEFECIIVGGSALILMECIPRATHDIDILSIYNPEVMKIFEKYDFNSQVFAYEDNFPYNYKDRIEKIDINTKVVFYYRASLEDMVISKLCAYRPTDQRDITEKMLVDKINWDLLEELSIELKTTLSDYRYQNFKFIYNQYVDMYKSKSN
jgi:hypothetical protein